MKLSILIPTIPERVHLLYELLADIHEQLARCGKITDVEILFDDRPAQKDGGPSTGEKRTFLLARARGEYVWQVDDDDIIEIAPVLAACDTGADVIGINGYMTTDGGNRVPFEIRLNHPYVADWSRGHEVYLRYPNHITPMRRELVNKFDFPMRSNFEDKEWADKIKEAGVLKTETVVEQDVYHYRFSNHNKSY